MVSEITCKYCDSNNIVKDGSNTGEQYFLCRSCNRRFNLKGALPGMKTAVSTIATAVSTYYQGLSINEVCEMLKQTYHIEVSDFAVYNWIERFTKDAIEATKYYRPSVGHVWAVDETVILVNGKKYWLWDVLDIKTRFLIASHLSANRLVEDAHKVLSIAYANTGVIPKVIISDGNYSYVNSIKLTFGDKTKHLQVKKFDATPNNNIIERMQGTIKGRTKVMRGLKSMDSANTILKGFLVYYNYFRAHDTLSTPNNPQTPADKANARFPYKDWENFIRYSQEAKTNIPPFFKQVPVLPVIKPTARQKHRIHERKRIRKIRELKKQSSLHVTKGKGNK